MRANEFVKSILLEYRRDITAARLGDRLIQALAKTRRQDVPLQLFKSYLILTASGDNIVSDQDKASIIDQILAEIESHDPTANKEYSQWLATVWANDKGQQKFEDLNNDNLLGAYTIGKRRRLIRSEHADINKFRTYREFEDAIRENYDIDYLIPQDRPPLARGIAEEVYKDEDVRVIVPKDEVAACYYGQSTRWCTAATRSINRFEQYNKTGNLYILLPKKPKYEGEKYQLHFPHEEFTDEQNQPVDVVEILKYRFPNLFKFFNKLGETDDLIGFIDDSVLVELTKIISEYALQQLYERIGEWEADDDGFRHYQLSGAIRKKYFVPEYYEKNPTKDDQMENPPDYTDIDWDRVYDDDELNDYLEYNDDADRLVGQAKWYTQLSSAKTIRELLLEDDMNANALGVSYLSIILRDLIKLDLNKLDIDIDTRIMINSEYQALLKYRKDKERDYLGSVGKYTVISD